MRPLNFASQPFRNERLPAVLFGVASVLLVATTLYHGFVVRTLLPARTSKLHREVASMEGELDRLQAESRSLQASRPPDKQDIAEWNVLKDLVDRRTFSWTGLFSRLEKVLPRNVRLISIAPNVTQGQVVLDIVAVAQPSQAGLGLVGLLEQRPEFEDVYPVNITEKDGGLGEFNYTMRYLPDVRPDEATNETAEIEEAEEPPAPTVAQPVVLQSPPAKAAVPPATGSAAALPPSGSKVAPAATGTAAAPSRSMTNTEPDRPPTAPAAVPGPVGGPQKRRFSPVEDGPSERNPTPDPGQPDTDSPNDGSSRKPTERDH